MASEENIYTRELKVRAIIADIAANGALMAKSSDLNGREYITSNLYALNNRLGIGDSNPSTDLDIYNGDASAVVRVKSPTDRADLILESGSEAHGDSRIKFQNLGSVKYTIGYDKTDGSFRISGINLETNNWMVLDTAGDFTFQNDVDVVGALSMGSISGNIIMTDDSWIGFSGAGRIEFDNQATDEINFLDCFVGIGTSTPARALDVHYTGDTAAWFRSSNADTAMGGSPTINLQNKNSTANNWAGISFSDSDGNALGHIGTQLVNHATNESRMELAVRPSGGSLTTAIEIESNGEVRLGDGTNYLSVEPDGSRVFVGTNAGVCYASIWAHDVADDLALAAQDTFYQIVSFDTNGNSNNATPDHTNNHITITKAGFYKFFLVLSLRATQSNDYDFHVALNNGTSILLQSTGHLTTAVVGRIITVSFGDTVDCAINDTVEVWVQRTTGLAVSKTVTFESINLYIEQVAGT